MLCNKLDDSDFPTFQEFQVALRSYEADLRRSDVQKVAEEAHRAIAAQYEKSRFLSEWGNAQSVKAPTSTRVSYTPSPGRPAGPDTPPPGCRIIVHRMDGTIDIKEG